MNFKHFYKLWQIHWSIHWSPNAVFYLFSNSMGMVRGLTCHVWEILNHSKSSPYHSSWVIRKVCAKSKWTNVPLASKGLRMKILVNYLCLPGDKNQNSKVEWWGGVLHPPPMLCVCAFVCVRACVCVFTSRRGAGERFPPLLSVSSYLHPFRADASWPILVSPAWKKITSLLNLHHQLKWDQDADQLPNKFLSVVPRYAKCP